jgi:hypothetical protein
MIEFEWDGNVLVACQGQHEVTLAANVNSPGGVELLMPDGGRMHSSVHGLAYFDRTSGESVLLAEAQDSQAVLFPLASLPSRQRE